MKGDYHISVPAGGSDRIFHADEGLPLSGFDNNGVNLLNTTTAPLKSECKDGDNNKTAPNKLGRNDARNARKKAARKAARKAAQTVVKKEQNNIEFYCGPCDRYCTSKKNLEQHNRTQKHKKRLLQPVRFRCDACNKHFVSEEGLEQHKQDKHKKLQKRLNKLTQDSAQLTNSDAISSSIEPERQLISDDSSQSGTVNWNEMYNEQFHDNHARIAEANREWNRANSQVEESTIRLQPDECPSTNQFSLSSANSANQTQANTDQYAQRSIAEPEESHDDKHNTDLSRSNGNLMKLTLKQSHQTKYPQGCNVIYSYEQDANDSDDILVRIGTVHAVYIDMSYSRQLVYEIKPNASSPEAMVFVEEHALAFAPQCPIRFHKTPSEASASLKDDAKALEGIVLASQWSIVKLSYTILLQRSAADEYSILKTNVSGENLSYRPPHSRP